MIGIYKITNKINNFSYIGSSVRDIEKRISNGHFSILKKNKHHNIHLQRSFNKYGIDNFYWEIIEECLPKDCLSREQYWIDLLNPHYNMCKIAGNTLGRKHSPETREKIRQIKIKQFSENTHKRNTGTKMSDEAKKNLSVKAKERYKDSFKKPFLGKHHTEETKKYVSFLKKGKPISESHRKAISKGHTGLKRSDDVKKKLSIANRKNKAWNYMLTDEAKLKAAKSRYKKVYQYDKELNLITIWLTAIYASEKLKIPKYIISHSCRTTTIKNWKKKKGNFIWSYQELIMKK